MRSVHSFCPSLGSRAVTEAEWLASSDPRFLLATLEPWAADEVLTDRQFRLFVCACARRLWHRLTDEWRRDVELAERFVDGEASEDELCDRWGETDPNQDIVDGLDLDLTRRCFLAWFDNLYHYRIQIVKVNWGSQEPPERAAQAALLRDIFGNPFQPVAFDPAWRSEQAVGIARKMYDERGFAAMPILADVMEEAGCDNQDILSHCREPGEHIRGCWVVDLVLGKQ